eukprot:Gb_03717 [translate_table: standard]
MAMISILHASMMQQSGVALSSGFSNLPELQASSAQTVMSRGEEHMPQYQIQKNALGHVRIDAPRCNTIYRACSSIKNVVQNAVVCLLDFMEMSRLVLATTIGRPSEVAPSAHERNASVHLFFN